MGNCLNKRGSSSMVWAAEDEEDEWEWESQDKKTQKTGNGNSSRLVVGGGGDDKNSSAAASSTSLKITISKKQLEQLLELVRKGENGTCNQEDQILLARLLADSGRSTDRHGGDMVVRQRSWRPRLQSIPELN
ncbi:unnamed protein product [Cuscuta epithymum]|uniref:Uncharacterized protein n=1 Tax=Cuscuta epithymum TaxID=186058 RepID=A0AAV0FX26_9ASTE|nr:unnamed protein product [Cuscuta epithymum]CAH9139600.1 unnamed protein product [Cuscuta epithymum]